MAGVLQLFFFLSFLFDLFFFFELVSLPSLWGPVNIV